jgi:hypothetical protein
MRNNNTPVLLYKYNIIISQHYNSEALKSSSAMSSVRSSWNSASSTTAKPGIRDVFPIARKILPDCVYEYLHVLDGYEFLPFKHFEIYVDTISPENDSFIWKYCYCNFWCEMLDPLIMERQLCVDCVAIPPGIRTPFRLIVCERLCAHIKQLFDIDIE